MGAPYEIGEELWCRVETCLGGCPTGPSGPYVPHESFRTQGTVNPEIFF